MYFSFVKVTINSKIKMKTKLTGNFAPTILIAMYIMIVVGVYIRNSYISPPQPILSVANNLTPMHSMEPDTATYLEYNKSTGTHTTYSFYRNINRYGLGGTAVAFVGTSSGTICDTCSIKWLALHSFEDNNIHSKYYIRLPLWKIKEDKSNYWYSDSVKFHLENEYGYVRKAVKTRETKTANGDYYNAYLVDIPVKFMYDQKNQYMLIPVSKSTKNIVNVVLIVVAISIGAFFLYLLGGFLNFTLDLSKGLAFTDNNIVRLKLISLTLIFYPIAIFILNLLMKVIFYDYFTTDVIMNKAAWIDSWKPIGTGLVFFLLYRAFRQGKLLKDEQDLTV